MAKRAKTAAQKIESVLTAEPQRVPAIAERAGVSMVDVFAFAASDPDGMKIRIVDMQTKPGRGQLTGLALR